VRAVIGVRGGGHLGARALLEDADEGRVFPGTVSVDEAIAGAWARDGAMERRAHMVVDVGRWDSEVSVILYGGCCVAVVPGRVMR